MKIPNCAAAPNSIRTGLSRSGVKSIIAPIPMKRSSRNSSFPIPALNKISSGPSSITPATFCVTAADIGRLTRIAPKPIGTKSEGSIFFRIPR